MEKVSNKECNIIFGLRPVIEAIDAGRQIDKVMIQNGLQGQLVVELKMRIKEHQIPFQFVPVEKLDHLTHANHQGVAATMAPISYQSFALLAEKLIEEGRAPFFVMLDHVTDVRNMGAIARTMECVGADALIVPAHGSAQISGDAIKTSAGALMRLPVCREENLKTVLNLSRQLGIQVVAASEKAATSYLSVDFTQPTLLVLGAEDKGVSPEVLKLCDIRAQLPIVGRTESLNVSVAAGVFMYEILRQRSV